MLVELFVPIVLFCVIGAIIISHIYYRHQEREQILAKDYTVEEINMLLKSPGKRKVWLLSTGIITISFGIGLGMGFLLTDALGGESIGVSLFIFVGIGMVVAYFIGEKIRMKDTL